MFYIFYKNINDRSGVNCECTEEGTYIDYYPEYLHCGTCLISVNTITFSEDFTYIMFDFGDVPIIEIKSIHVDDFLKPSRKIIIFIYTV